jgi:hypothetical protein
MPTIKYQSKAVFWDRNRQIVINKLEADKLRPGEGLKLPSRIIRFDSTHEFKVYLELIRMYGDSNVVRQHPLQIFPKSACYPRGKTWRVDFAILTDSSPYTFSHFVEAKGLMLPEFRCVLASLEQNNREAFNRLTLVFPRAIPLDNNLICSLHRSEHWQHLLALPELEKLKTLP